MIALSRDELKNQRKVEGRILVNRMKARVDAMKDARKPGGKYENADAAEYRKALARAEEDLTFAKTSSRSCRVSQYVTVSGKTTTQTNTRRLRLCGWCSVESAARDLACRPSSLAVAERTTSKRALQTEEAYLLQSLRLRLSSLLDQALDCLET